MENRCQIVGFDPIGPRILEMIDMKIYAKNILTLGLLILSACVWLGSAAVAQSINLTVTPTEGTINSVWQFTAVYTEPHGAWPSGTGGDLGVNPGILFLRGLGSVTAVEIPMYLVKGDNPAAGLTYKVTLTAGLNMWDHLNNIFHPEQYPETYLTAPDPKDPTSYALTWGPQYNSVLWDANALPIWYAPYLISDVDNTGNITAECFANWIESTPSGPVPHMDVGVKSNVVAVTVNDTFESTTAANMIDYGWSTFGIGDDYLFTYPYQMNSGIKEVDPLEVGPWYAVSGSGSPSIGSSSHLYTWRVRYKGTADPKPWCWYGQVQNDLHTSMPLDDYSLITMPSGVVFYFDAANTNDYLAYGMRQDASYTDTDKIYSIWCRPSNGWAYVSLPIGVYHYFFGTSDDTLTFSNKPFDFMFYYQPVPAEWGEDMSKMRLVDWSFGLDPWAARKVTGYSYIDRPAGRRFQDGTAEMVCADQTLYIDRTTRAPGYNDRIWMDDYTYNQGTYKYDDKCTQYPEVTLSLDMPAPWDANYRTKWEKDGVAFNDIDKYGTERFFGTIAPYTRAINPLLPGSAAYGIPGIRAESCGVTKGEKVEFRIRYRELYNRAPVYIKVFINNASARSRMQGVSSDTVGGQSTDRPASDYEYTGYTMIADPPAKGQPQDYKTGVWYRYSTTLPPGPHTYYFEAKDSYATCIWPRRGDADEGGDTYVPPYSAAPKTAADMAKTADGYDTYDNNDFVPGPYVNTAPVLSDWSVTPSSGKVNTSYRFRVKYSDADGQRPYSAYVYIKNTDGGVPVQCQMVPETVLKPTEDNRAAYKAGVYYIFDTATMQTLSMQPGTRSFYFEFIDDWGRIITPADRVKGEKVFTTSDGKQWKDGPIITGPIPPTLTEGKFESADGTSNSATMWKFSVKYVDRNNDPPSIVKLFIGQKQADGKTILWDDGHTMLESDPTDSVFTDGKYYYYNTRLAGKDFPEDNPKEYYYAFVANDGTAWAKYNAVAKSDKNYSWTDSSSAFVFTEQLTGNTGQKLFAFNPPIPNSVIVGPLSSKAFSTSALTDARIFTGGSIGTTVDGIPNEIIDGTEIVVDDQKGGWQQSNDRYCVMKGIATTSDRTPSITYVVPDHPELIASVEGVYRYKDLDASSDDPTNYYDPAAVGINDELTPIPGRLDTRDASRKTIFLGANDSFTEAWRVGTVSDVFAGPNGDVSVGAGNFSELNGQGQILLDNAIGAMDEINVVYKRSGYWTGAPVVWLTTDLPAEYGQQVKTVYIKYYDNRFAHQGKGLILGSTNPLMTAFAPYASNVKTNSAGDRTSGLLGVWGNEELTGINYFDPFRGAPYNDPTTIVLSVDADATGYDDYMYGMYYQSGDYWIDRTERKVQFTDNTAAPLDPVFATYIFGTQMMQADGVTPITIGQNTAPFLSDPKVTPVTGSGTTSFTYSITYKDIDGENGQAPEYVRVYIDNVPHNMTTTGTAYNAGVNFTYTTTGLQGGSHTYRFDCSDGTLVAWVDADPLGLLPYRLHRFDEITQTSNLNDEVHSFNGPWINTPPTLTNGSVTPTEVKVTGSLEYRVDFTDIDNDAPFVYDSGIDAPAAANTIGTPRVWIDGAVGVTTSAKVVSVAADPLEPSKMRVMNCTTLLGGNPNWQVDQYKGHLLQISSGVNMNRVYLISSNTANSVSLSTDDLGVELSAYIDQNDKQTIKAGTPLTFRIDGLVMTKLDPALQDFTKGMTYHISVPRLPVGAHTYSFSARSRLTKPQWLLDLEASQNITSLPYTDVIYFPGTGNLNGPTVTSGAPDGNVAPILAGNAVLSGPYAKKADEINPSLVRLISGGGGNWTAPEIQNVSQISGVFRNATLDANANYDQTNFLDTPVSTLSPDSDFATTAALPAIAGGTEMVQFGTPEGSSLISVIPDSTQAIANGGVIGVYLTAAMDGVNYYGLFNGTKISVSAPLPSGTTRVYIKYISSGVGFPPVYIKYIKKAPAVYLSGDPVTFRGTYQDADNDPPAYHGGVRGYVNLLINGAAQAQQMLPMPPIPTDWRNPQVMSVTVNNVTEGLTKYHFEGSDGYDPDHLVRYPTDAANDFSLTVNHKPTLSVGTVSPATGQPGTEYSFSVTCQDLDAPTVNPDVRVRLTKIDGPTLSELGPFSMTPGTGAIATGKVYTLKIPSSNPAISNLDIGTYTVAFEVSDAYQAGTPIVVAQNLLVRSTNGAPVIVDAAVAPTAGKLNQQFVYKAWYRDPDGDPPSVLSGMIRQEGLTLIIDKGASNAQTIILKRVGTGAVDYKVAAGVLFQSDVAVSGASLGDGVHTYEVQASDGTLSANPVLVNNSPVVLVPQIDQVRVVSAMATDPATAPSLTAPALGDPVLLLGRIKFPKNTVTSKPQSMDNDSNTRFTVVKPDGASFSLNAKVTMLADSTDPLYWIGTISVAKYEISADSSTSSGSYMQLNSSGDWKIQAFRMADNSWEAVRTDSTIDGKNDQYVVSVGGSLRTIAVKDASSPETSIPLIDMITPAMVIADGDVGKVFGYDWAALMQIVRWDPLTKSYYRYGSSAFPIIMPGDALWIKPRMNYAAESIRQSDVDSGLLCNGNPSTLLDATKRYRLIHSNSKAYSMQYNSVKGAYEYVPATVQLYAGWNQFGSIFFNRKKNSSGALVDVGLPFSELRVKRLNQELSIADAAAAGWIRDYAWRYDAEAGQYVLVSGRSSASEKVLKAWSGYWIRALVDCQLIINPNTTYSGASLKVDNSRGTIDAAELESPPAIPN